MENKKEEDKDKYLPIQNIQKVMKRAVPDNVKITKEAKEFVQECTSEFIFFVTGDAADACNSEKRKTITGEDVINSFKHVGFHEYAEVLERHLANYRIWKETEGLKKKKQDDN